MAENVLGTLFGDIAKAIRGKTGDTATMKPAEFPEQIRKISTSNVIDNVEVQLDFANGDQTERLPEGYSANSVTIFKPENLAPENIAEGINIAGIIGTHSGGGGGGAVIVKEGDLKWEQSRDGKYVWDEDGNEMTVYHNLGVVPDLLIITVSLNDTIDNLEIVAIIGMSEAYLKKINYDQGVWCFRPSGNYKCPWGIDSNSNPQSHSLFPYMTTVYGSDDSVFKITRPTKNGLTTGISTGKIVSWAAFGNII